MLCKHNDKIFLVSIWTVQGNRKPKFPESWGVWGKQESLQLQGRSNGIGFGSEDLVQWGKSKQHSGICVYMYRYMPRNEDSFWILNFFHEAQFSLQTHLSSCPQSLVISPLVEIYSTLILPCASLIMILFKNCQFPLCIDKVSFNIQLVYLSWWLYLFYLSIFRFHKGEGKLEESSVA